MRKAWPAWLVPLALAPLALAACEDVDVRVYAYGLPPEDVRVEVEDLGRLGAARLEARRRQGDLDGVALLDEGTCGGPCHVVEVTLFVENRGTAPLPPPVVRLSSPLGQPPRVPVAFRAQEISPGRTGRLRFLVALFRGERAFDVRLSGSVLIDVKTDDVKTDDVKTSEQ